MGTVPSMMFSVPVRSDNDTGTLSTAFDGKSVSRRTKHSVGLEVEAKLHGFGARREVVRPTERRKKVVKRYFVRQVDHR